jgi:hypothetical protein
MPDDLNGEGSTQVNTQSRSRDESASLASSGAKYNFRTDKGRLVCCIKVKEC